MTAEPAPSRAPQRLFLVPQAVVRCWSGLTGNIRGALLVLLGAFLLTIMSAMFKVLGQRLPPFEVMFFRFLAGLIVMLPIVARRGVRLLRTEKHGLHFLRGLFGTMGNACAVYAVVHMALADAITIQFSRPLFMLAVAGLFLGEIVGWGRALAALAGFSGILMITRPFGEGFQPWALVAALGALNGTMVVLTVKLLSKSEQTVVVMFYFALWTTVLSFVPMLIFWQTPSWGELVALAFTGVLGIVGQSCFTHGIRLGETTFVLPFDYTRIVFGAIFGAIVFAEIPDHWSFAGAAVIIGASLYLVRNENRKRRSARPAPEG